MISMKCFNKSRATIKSPLQRPWVVHIHANKGGHFFEDGWRRFVDDHHLNEADLLVFEYEGLLQFSVKLFDSTACEKEYPSSTRKTSEECIIGTKFDEPLTTSPSGMPDEECEIKQKSFTTGRSRDKDVHQSDGISYFKATISQFNICYSYLGIPSKFSAMNGFRDKREITVGDSEGREWQLRISHSRGKQRNQRFFYGDWLNFARVNGLVVGDVCTFEYNPGGEKDIMYVSILKKQSEPVMEDTKERGTSSKIEDQSPSTCLKRRTSHEESEVMLKKHATMSSKEIASPKCFKASIKPSNLTHRYMNIPKEFINSQDLKKRDKLYLRDPIGTLWKVEIFHKQEPVICSDFSRGWPQLANGNRLKVGDVRVFEIDEDQEDTMNVYIDKKTKNSPTPPFSLEC